MSTWNRLAAAGDAKSLRAIIEEKQRAERGLKAGLEVGEFRTWLEKFATVHADPGQRLRAVAVLEKLT